MLLPFHSAEPIGEVGEVCDLVIDESGTLGHRVDQDVVESGIADAVGMAALVAALGGSERQVQRIADAWEVEIANGAAQRKVVARKRHDDVQPTSSKHRHRERVVRCRVVDESHRRFLRPSQRVRRREQIEDQHVQPALPHVARLFGRKRRVIDRVEIFDRLRLAVDEQLEVFACERGDRRAVRADIDRNLDNFDGRALAQLRRRPGGECEGQQARELSHGFRQASTPCSRIYGETVNSLRAKPRDVVPSIRRRALAT